MKVLNIRRSATLAAVASFVVAFLGVTQANAGSITFEQTITLSDSVTFPPPPPAPPTLPQISLLLPYEVTLPQFDPSMGTLTGVSINATTLNQSATLNLTNNTNALIDVALANNSGRAIFELPGFLANLVTSEDRPNSTVPVGANSTESLDFTPFPIELGDATPSDFTPYLGAGNFTAQVNASRGVLLLPNGALSATASGSATARFSVTYQYIPEPTSAALLGLGAVTLGRRARSASR
ncbi:MAG: choice-of-anchor E domain-containing protein [Planctomycetota bacterium]